MSLLRKQNIFIYQVSLFLTLLATATFAETSLGEKLKQAEQERRQEVVAEKEKRVKIDAISTCLYDSMYTARGLNPETQRNYGLKKSTTEIAEIFLELRGFVSQGMLAKEQAKSLLSGVLEETLLHTVRNGEISANAASSVYDSWLECYELSVD